MHEVKEDEEMMTSQNVSSSRKRNRGGHDLGNGPTASDRTAIHITIRKSASGSQYRDAIQT